MGYTTVFDGEIRIDPPLNSTEMTYLYKFSDSRRMDRISGPYFVDGGRESFNDYRDPNTDVRDHNSPPPEQPGLWCRWVPSPGGLEWDGGEKFYNSGEWMRYVIDHFLKPGAVASESGDPQFKDFTFDHICNGMIEAEGEESGDFWRLHVIDNVVSEVRPTIVWPEPRRVICN